MRRSSWPTPRSRAGSPSFGSSVDDLVARRTAAVPGRVATLDHEVRHDAVERESVVEALAREEDEVVDALGRVLGVERNGDVAAGRGHDGGVGLGRVDGHRRRGLFRVLRRLRGLRVVALDRGELGRGDRRAGRGDRGGGGRGGRDRGRGRRARDDLLVVLVAQQGDHEDHEREDDDGDRGAADRAVPLPLLLLVPRAPRARLGRFPSCVGVCQRLGTAAECTGRRNPSVVRQAHR